MKQIIGVLLTFAAVGLGFAQGSAPGNERGDFRGPRPYETRHDRFQPESLSLSGTLEVLNGRIALKDGDRVYYVSGIQHLIGFVDGLKEGARVSLEGYAFPVPEGPEYRQLRVTKLTVDQKSYEIPFGPAYNGPGRPVIRQRTPMMMEPRGPAGPHHRRRDREPRRGLY
jgi:hypothetical protein